MKFITAPFVLIVLSFALWNCNGKDKNAEPTLPTECMSPLSDIDSGFFMTLPTAFSPTGDGYNDIFIPMAKGLDTSGYQLSIFKIDGHLVFQTNDIHQAWVGTDLNGNIDTSYLHSVRIKYKNAKGQIVDTCSYLYLLLGSGCIHTVPADRPKYIFTDQFDSFNGTHPYTTVETFCL